jgi:splicing suppressor protein 51
MVSSTSPPKCANCPTTTNPKRCAKCQNEFYCSHSCQKIHWKQHKKSCSNTGAAPKPTPPSSTHNFTGKTKNLSTVIDKPFHKLHAGTWLHDRCETDVFKLLIDTFRLRCTDDYIFDGKISNSTVQAGEQHSKSAFEASLRFVTETKPAFLPPWWSTDKAEEYIAYGMNTNNRSNLYSAVTKQDLVEHYGHKDMPMQMRMLYEKITGRGPMGHKCDGMLQMQMSVERGECKMVNLNDIFGASGT